MFRLAACCLVLSLLPTVAAAWSTLDDWAAVVATQIRARKPVPALSAYGAGLSLPDAYEVQRRVVRELGHDVGVAGFKASLTRPRGQVEFRVREPVTGVILDRGVLRGAPTLRRHEFARLTIAPGLGFVTRRAISSPLRDLAELDALIGAVMPVVDFSDMRFDRTGSPSVTDLVASNTAFARLLVGKPLPEVDLAALDGTLVELARDTAVIDRGRGVNFKGGQRTALFWLINRLLAQGWSLPSGTLLVTGGLSDPVPAEPGDYVANFRDLAELRFMVTR
jgi:2-oxo-3-hexenedioate decarboxylase